MNSISWIQIVMLFGSFQGVILIIALCRKSSRQNPSNTILVPFIGTISLLLLFVTFVGMGILPSGGRLGSELTHKELAT